MKVKIVSRIVPNPEIRQSIKSLKEAICLVASRTEHYVFAPEDNVMRSVLPKLKIRVEVPNCDKKRTRVNITTLGLTYSSVLAEEFEKYEYMCLTQVYSTVLEARRKFEKSLPDFVRSKYMEQIITRAETLGVISTP